LHAQEEVFGDQGGAVGKKRLGEVDLLLRYPGATVQVPDTPGGIPAAGKIPHPTGRRRDRITGDQIADDRDRQRHNFGADLRGVAITRSRVCEISLSGFDFSLMR
jgi:hypothetical protein